MLFFVFSCSKDNTKTDLQDDQKIETVSLDEKIFAEFLKNRTIDSNLKKGQGDSCSLKAEDLVGTGSSSCFVQFVNASVPTFGTSLSGTCTSVPVSYTLSWCIAGSKVINIVISDFKIDYTALISSCPSFNPPSGVGALESYLIDLEREFSEVVELIEVNNIFGQYNGGCEFLEEPVSVTRVTTLCFQYCYLPPQGLGGWILERRVYEGDLCCYKRKKICADENGNLVIVQDGQWSSLGECTGSLSCEGLHSTENCEHDCLIVF